MADVLCIRYTLTDQFNIERAYSIVPASQKPNWPSFIQAAIDGQYGWIETASEPFWLNRSDAEEAPTDAETWKEIASGLFQALVAAEHRMRSIPWGEDKRLRNQITQAIAAYSAEVGWGDGSVQLPLDGDEDGEGSAPTDNETGSQGGTVKQDGGESVGGSAGSDLQHKRRTAGDAKAGKARKRKVVSAGGMDEEGRDVRSGDQEGSEGGDESGS